MNKVSLSKVNNSIDYHYREKIQLIFKRDKSKASAIIIPQSIKKKDWGVNDYIQ